MKVKSFSRVRCLVTPWTAAHQAPPSMGFSRQEYWSQLPLPSPEKLLLLLLSHFSLVQLCVTIDGSPPGSPIPGILQARTLEWVAISFSNAWKWKVKVKSFSRVRLHRPHGLQPSRFLCKEYMKWWTDPNFWASYSRFSNFIGLLFSILSEH